MDESLDFDVHLQWLEIALKRIVLFNSENKKPLLSLSFTNNKCPLYNDSTSFPDKLSINDLSTGFPYAFVLNVMKELPKKLSEPVKLFPTILSTLQSLGYKPSGRCEIDQLISGSKRDHIELLKIIEWAVVDRSLSIQMLCDDVKRLPRSFFILEQQPDMLDDTISLWLSKFPCSHTLPVIKDFRTEIFQGQHVAFSLSRTYPKRILKDEINVGTELTDSMITQNWELAAPVMEELMVFVPPMRQFSSPHLLNLFFADIFYATRSSAKKFVRLDKPPPIVVEPKPYAPRQQEATEEDSIQQKLLRQQKARQQQQLQIQLQEKQQQQQHQSKSNTSSTSNKPSTTSTSRNTKPANAPSSKKKNPSSSKEKNPSSPSTSKDKSETNKNNQNSSPSKKKTAPVKNDGTSSTSKTKPESTNKKDNISSSSKKKSDPSKKDGNGSNTKMKTEPTKNKDSASTSKAKKETQKNDKKPIDDHDHGHHHSHSHSHDNDNAENNGNQSSHRHKHKHKHRHERSKKDDSDSNKKSDSNEIESNDRSDSNEKVPQITINQIAKNPSLNSNSARTSKNNKNSPAQNDEKQPNSDGSNEDNNGGCLLYTSV